MARQKNKFERQALSAGNLAIAYDNELIRPLGAVSPRSDRSIGRTARGRPALAMRAW